VAVIVW